MTLSKSKLDDAVKKVGLELLIWSQIDEMWVIDLNTYRNIRLTDEVIALYHFNSLAYGILLACESVKIYLHEEDLDYLREHLIIYSDIAEHIDHNTDLEDRHSLIKYFDDLVNEFSELRHADTLENYVYILRKITEPNLSCETVMPYAEYKLKMFDKLKLRDKILNAVRED